MSGLLAAALLASSVQAGVVMPVEGAAASLSPSGLAVAAGRGVRPVDQRSLGLAAVLPLLPSPLPGLIGAVHFVSDAHVTPAPQAEPGLARGRRAADIHSLPGVPGTGRFSVAAARDGSDAAPAKGPALPRPEKSVQEGRRLFDQEAERGELGSGSAPARAAPSGSSGILGRDASRAPRAAASSSHRGEFARPAGAARGADAAGSGSPAAARDEALRDAVASPAWGASGGVPPRTFGMAPNGEMPSTRQGALPAAAPAVPRPLALDLSGSGLIVRVRSALNGAFAPELSRPPEPAPAIPGPSTAWLERGAMLEAFSVANAHAQSPTVESSSLRRIPSTGRIAAAPAPVGARSGPAALSLWWAWLALPLFAAAFRAIP